MQWDYTTGILSFYYESRRMEIFPIPQTAGRNFTSGEANKIRNIAFPAARDFGSDERMQTEDVSGILRGLGYAQMGQKIRRRQRAILLQTKQTGLQMYFVYLKARFVNGWSKRAAADKMKKLPPI